MGNEQKKCLRAAALAFMLSLLLFTALFNFGNDFSWAKTLLGLLIASGAAAGGFFGAKMIQ